MTEKDVVNMYQNSAASVRVLDQGEWHLNSMTSEYNRVVQILVNQEPWNIEEIAYGNDAYGLEILSVKAVKV